MSRGYFTIAQGDEYVRHAYALALSLKLTQKTVSNISIGITPGCKVDKSMVSAFDQIIEIPWGDDAVADSWKLKNEWKVIYMSPYDETVKLDADMLFFADVSDWWDFMSTSEMIFTTDVHSYREELVTSDYYRKVFTDNKLPNVYSGFFYFKKTPATFEFFNLSRVIFESWNSFAQEFLDAKNRPAEPSTDVVFGLAAKILDTNSLNKIPTMNIPTFTHMKTQLQGWKGNYLKEEWTDNLPMYFTPACKCKIGIYEQRLPLHYHVKTFLTDKIIKYLEKEVAKCQ